METFYPSTDGRDVLVMIVEDEKVSRKALGMLLARRGYTALAVGTAEEAADVLAVSIPPAMIVIDIDLPGMSGADFLKQILKSSPWIQPVLVTAAGEDRLIALRHANNVPCLRKPINLDELFRTMDDQRLAN